MSTYIGEVKCLKCGIWLIPKNYCSNCGHKFTHTFLRYDDVNEYETKVEHHICGYHKEFPDEYYPYPYCTCSSSYSLRKKKIDVTE